MTQNFYPASQVSRNLDPSNKAFRTVVGRHDSRITDADINLLQDVQDAKLKAVFDNMVFSGMVSGSPFVFEPVSGVLKIPTFNVHFNGEILTIGGAHSTDSTYNRVLIPSPVYPGPNSDEAKIFVIYLELWYRYTDPQTGSGYYIDPLTQSRYFYPNGCFDADPSTLIPDDVVDPFEGLVTTGRVQTQWAIRVSSLPWTYNFDSLRFGLDKGPNLGETLYGQAFQDVPVSLSGYEFSNMGVINGDYGLWRSGTGTPRSALGTVDGYTYALPVAVLFQRNKGDYSISSNPFGCKSLTVQNSGLVMYGISGRPDGKFADVVYPEDIVDTRLSVSLEATDPLETLERNFSDLVTGNSKLKISRGDGVGCKTIALGSMLPYTISIGPSPVSNTDYLGTFDGFMNGFSSDSRIFYTTKMITTSMKVLGTQGGRWSQGDTFTISMQRVGAVVDNVVIQALHSNTDGSLSPVMLYTGQVEVTGLGSQSLTFAIASNLIGTPFDPSTYPLFITLGVRYPAASKYDLRVVPDSVSGGTLTDSVSGTFPMFGVSEYDIISSRTLAGSTTLKSYNPSYSSSIFGTHASFRVSSSAGVRSISNSSVYTTFTIPRNVVDQYNGAFITSAKDVFSKTNVTISNRGYSSGNLTVTLYADYQSHNTVLEFDVLLVNTAQVGYNAPVQGVLAIEEVVTVGQNLDNPLTSDSRIKVLSTTQSATTNTILLGASDCILRGVAGDAVGVKQIFVKNEATGVYNAYPLSSVHFLNGVASITFPTTGVGIVGKSWFLVASILPAFTPTSSLVLSSTYIPYQGEGVAGRKYSVMFSEDTAIVTTNGTGSSPVVGIRDIFPYNRELPLTTVLPSQSSWVDSDLTNQPINVFVNTNYESKQQNNVEHTVKVPLHTNDFIEPLTGWKKKNLVLSTKSGKGFSRAFPHVGFAIKQPHPRNVLGDSIMATAGPITLYVNNLGGNDTNDGLSRTSAKKTIQSALDALPPVLRHPVTVYLVDSGHPYSIKDAQDSNYIKVAAFGDGVVRNVKYYCVYNMAFEIQSAGRLLMTCEPGTTNPIVISGEGAIPYGDGSISAFIVSDSRVLFNGIKFQAFQDQALKVIDSDTEVINCIFEDNLQAISAEEGSSVVISGGEFNLSAGQTGVVLTDSVLTVTNHTLTGNPNCNAFYIGERGSHITLRSHNPSQETNILNSTVVAVAKINSSIICSSDFVSNGGAHVVINSVLTKSGSNPFLGGVTSDGSVVTPVITDIS